MLLLPGSGPLTKVHVPGSRVGHSLPGEDHSSPKGWVPCSRSKETSVPRLPVLIFSTKRIQLYVAWFRTSQQNWITDYTREAKEHKGLGKCFGVGRTRRLPDAHLQAAWQFCFLICHTGVIPSSLVCYEK